MKRISVKHGISQISDSAAAILDIKSQISNNPDSFKIVFCSSHYDLKSMGQAIKENLGDNVIACTTAGEISPIGLSYNGISAVSIESEFMKFSTYHIDDLRSFSIKDAIEIAEDFLKKDNSTECINCHNIGLMLIDGLSLLEDNAIALLSKAFQPIDIIGGSAGDNMNFESTFVYRDGAFHSNTASLLMIESQIPIKAIKTQHFEPTDKKLVITESDSANRIVYEINGEKAAIEYASILGIPVEELNPQVFAKYPVMLNIAGNWYVRSIAKTNPDHSLTFFCAIDNGLVLTIAEGKDIINNYKIELDSINSELGEYSLIIAFDCILRRYELEQKGLVTAVNDLLTGKSIVGFSTYGEQCNSVHVNQTLTGIAIGN